MTGIFDYRKELPSTRVEISAGEGHTPIVPLARLGRQVGLPRLYAKLEGCNPTGSYKDRVAALSISLAIEAGKSAWIATSSGNAGTSFAAYGSRANMPGFLCAVSSIPREKLLPIQFYGNTHTILIEGVGNGGDKGSEQTMFQSVQHAAARHNLFLAVTAHRYNEEGMRGADTISYELVDTGFANAVVYVPTGGGGLAAAICRGAKSRQSGMRVVAAQPAGCSPIAQYLNGDLAEPVIPRCETMISGLQLPSPPDGELAARSIDSTGGWGTAVSDEQIAKYQALLSTVEGTLVEPASATALAAAVKDRQEGRLDADDQVVLVLTATGLKDLQAVEAQVSAPARLPANRVPDAVDAWYCGRQVRGAPA